MMGDQYLVVLQAGGHEEPGHYDISWAIIFS